MESPENKSRLRSLYTRLSQPISAPVVDLFRVLSGLLTFAYFIRHFIEFSLYTSESGLLDHQLHRELFWFTEFSLFFPGSGPVYQLCLLGLGLLASVAITLGLRPKVGVVVAWLIAVSVQRWNFAVINVDDSSVTLLLWWMLFLPIGHTLTLRTLRGLSDWRQESRLVVHGFFVRALFANLFIYYLTAGLSKLSSGLWREGLALYVILNLPLARTQGLWHMDHLPFLWLGNHFTLIMEPLFPFLVLLRPNSPLKWFGGVCWVVFHLSMPLTIGVPYANFALIICLILVFHKELGDLFVKKAGGTETAELISVDWKPAAGTRQLICAYLLVLFLAMQKNVPILEQAWEPAMGTLYWAGIAQEYHLFDWIDLFNWTIAHKVMVTPAGGTAFEVPSHQLFPHSVRGFIVQSYLLPMRWMRVPRPLTGEMRNGILKRAVARYVRSNSSVLGDKGEIVVTSTVGRLTKDDLQGEECWQIPLFKAHYDQDLATFEYPDLPTEASP